MLEPLSSNTFHTTRGETTGYGGNSYVYNLFF